MRHFFQNKTDGFFVDVGSHDPFISNMTYFFEVRGWSRIAIEPLPDKKVLWEKYRKAKFYNHILSSKKKVKFTNLKRKESGYNALSYETSHQSWTNNTKLQYSHGLHLIRYEPEEIEVTPITLNDIPGLPVEIDFLSLHTNGSEIEALKTIDFKYFDIKVLCIHNVQPIPFGSEKIRKFMKLNDYIFSARYHNEGYIFYHKDFFQSRRD